MITQQQSSPVCVQSCSSQEHTANTNGNSSQSSSENGDENAEPALAEGVFAPLKFDTNSDEWFDYKWQLANRITTFEKLGKYLNLTEEEKAYNNTFPFAVTPYIVSLMDANNPNDPIRRQFIPTKKENPKNNGNSGNQIKIKKNQNDIEEISNEEISNEEISNEEMDDSLGEEKYSPVKGIVHRYPDRALMLVSMKCACYCRFCTRNRIVGKSHGSVPDLEKQLDYIRRTPQIRDVIVSGGDPLLLEDEKIEYILTNLYAIPHLEIIRIGTRVPMVLPQRIVGRNNIHLIEILKKFANYADKSLWMNIHINHPKEFTHLSKMALGILAGLGIPLGSQTVLLAGINNCPNIMKTLFHECVRNRVKPYYMYICDSVTGASHFKTPVSTGIEIMENLCGHTSGLCLPTFVVDLPNGGGKVPVYPTYMISSSDTTTIFRNYEGFITYYGMEQSKYQKHKKQECNFCKKEKQNIKISVKDLLDHKYQSIYPALDDRHMDNLKENSSTSYH